MACGLLLVGNLGRVQVEKPTGPFQAFGRRLDDVLLEDEHEQLVAIEDLQVVAEVLIVVAHREEAVPAAESLVVAKQDTLHGNVWGKASAAQVVVVCGNRPVYRVAEDSNEPDAGKCRSNPDVGRGIASRARNVGPQVVGSFLSDPIGGFSPSELPGIPVGTALVVGLLVEEVDLPIGHKHPRMATEASAEPRRSGLLSTNNEKVGEWHGPAVKAFREKIDIGYDPDAVTFRLCCDERRSGVRALEACAPDLGGFLWKYSSTSVDPIPGTNIHESAIDAPPGRAGFFTLSCSRRRAMISRRSTRASSFL